MKKAQISILNTFKDILYNTRSEVSPFLFIVHSI